MARLGDLLVQAGSITREQLDFALRTQRERGGRLGQNLVDLGFVSESLLSQTLAAQLKIPAANAAALDTVPPEVLRIFPADTAAHHRAIPVLLEGGALWVAMSDPTDSRAIAELMSLARRPIKVMVAPDLLVAWALERHYGVRARQRPDDVKVKPHLDLTIDDSAPGPSDVPTAFPDPYTDAERRSIDARMLALDQRQAAGRMGLGTLGARLVKATSQREAFDALLSFLAQDFAQLVVLVLRNGRLAGFTRLRAGQFERELPDASAPPGEVPIIARALADGRPRLGRASERTFGALTPVVGTPDSSAVLVLPLVAFRFLVQLLLDQRQALVLPGNVHQHTHSDG